VLLLEDDVAPRPMISTFLKIVEGVELEVDLLRCRFQSGGRLNFLGKGEAGAPSHPEEPDNLLNSAEEMLTEEGRAAKESLVVQDTPLKIAEYLEDYSLVVSFLSRQKAMKGPLLDLLARVPSAILLCRG